MSNYYMLVVTYECVNTDIMLYSTTKDFLII